MISDCPTDQEYDACLTDIVQKGINLIQSKQPETYLIYQGCWRDKQNVEITTLFSYIPKSSEIIKLMEFFLVISTKQKFQTKKNTKYHYTL